MESPSGPAKAASGRFRPAMAVFALLLVTLVAAALALSFPPSQTRAPAPPGSPVEFQHPWILGNATAGWTYRVNVTVIPAWETPRPIVWGDLRVRVDLVLNTSYGRYPYPPGSTLRAVDASNRTIAVEDLATGLWQDGLSVLIVTGQGIVLQGDIPPGTTYANQTTITGFEGPTFVIEYANAGEPVAWLLPIQGPWIYT